MKKNILFKQVLFILIIFSSKVYSQTNENNLPNIYPIAPNAYEFTKYGEVPVSKYTGVPNITIPIYTIDTGNLKIPINLTYHSNGFRVNEDAGWTGLGWTLNEGGTITQIVSGFDDFDNRYHGYVNRDLPNMDAIIHHATNGIGPTYVFSSTGCYNNTFVNLNTTNFQIGEGGCVRTTEPYSGVALRKLFGGDNVDFEPDIFKFNFLGYSGTFVLDWKTETFKCLSDSRFRILKPENSHNQITIISPEGHKFIFSIKDEADSYGINANSFTITSRVYKLDIIETTNNKRIEYFYTTPSSVNNFPIYNSSFVFYEDDGNNHNGTNNFFGLGSPLSSLSETGQFFSKTYTKQTYTQVNTIKFDEGVILFSMSDRLDLIGAKKLDSIKIKSSETSSKTIKQFNFNYDYFIGDTESNEFSIDDSDYPLSDFKVDKKESELTHRLKLNSLSESGKGSYTFQYNELPVLPKKNSFATDYWGFYNGAISNKSYYPNMSRFNFEFNPIRSGLSLVLDNNNIKSANGSFSRAALLKTITYPTNGYTHFFYESNTFKNSIVPNYYDAENKTYDSTHISYGAGVRIRKIVNFDNNNKLTTKKTFTYKGGKITNPVIFLNKTYIKRFEYSSGGNGKSYNASGYRTKISTSNFTAPSINSNGNFVGYDEVTEHIVSNESDLEHIGKIIYTYENKNYKGTLDLSKSYHNNSTWKHIGNYLELQLPLYQDNLSKPKNGSLLEKKVFDKNDVLSEKQVNKYNTYKSEFCSFGARRGGVNLRVSCGFAGDTSYKSSYMLGAYPIRGVNSYLKNSKTIQYFQKDSIVNEKKYFYTNNFQLKEERTITSKKDSINTHYQYPFDFPNDTGNNISTLINMVSKNILTPIIKQETTLNNKSVSKQAAKYKDWDANLILPEFIKSSKGNNPLEDKIIFHSYDNKGNPTEVSNKDGTHIVYLWGYSGTLQIAKIENTTYSDFIVALRRTGDIKGAINEHYLTRINSLRESNPEWMITTYTHIPLVGVEKITQPNGVSTHYEYDDFNRLKAIKDQDGNLIESFEFNYANRE